MLSHMLRAATARNVFFTLSASDGTVTSSITVPAGVQQGDLLIVYNHAYNTTGTIPTAATPSGFTQVYNSSLANASGSISARAISSYKLALGNESGTSLTCMTANFMAVFILVYKTNSVSPNLTLLYTGSGGGANMTNANPTDYTLSLSAQNKPVLAIGACFNQTDTQISFSPAPDTQIPASNSIYRLAPKIFNSSPSNFSVTAGDGGVANFNSAFAFELS